MSGVSEQTGAIAWPESKPFVTVSKGYTYFEEGDVLFAKITPCMQNGKHAIATGLANGFGFGTTEFHVIRPGPTVTADWIHRFLRQSWVLEEATRHFRGAVGQQRVPKEFLQSLPIPLPPLAEQKRIVAILNQQLAAAERAKKAAQERLEAAQALRKVLLRAMFSELRENTQTKCSTEKLGDICTVVTGTTPVKSNPAFYGGEIPWVNPSRIGLSKYVSDSDEHLTDEGLQSARLVPPGSVLVVCISGSRNNIGKASIAERSLATNQQINAVIPRSGVDSEFLYYHLLALKSDLESLAASTNQNIVNKSKIEEVTVLLPPLVIQRRIAAQLSDVFRTVRSVEDCSRDPLNHVGKLSETLLRRAFSGEI